MKGTFSYNVGPQKDYRIWNQTFQKKNELTGFCWILGIVVKK